MTKKLMILVLLVLGMASTANARYWQLQYRGTVGNYAVEVALGYNTGDVATNGVPYWIDGSYYRYVNHPDQRLELKEKCTPSSKTWIFEEYEGRRHTGHWVLKKTKDGLTGTFTALKTGKKYTVKLKMVTGEDDWDWAY